MPPRSLLRWGRGPSRSAVPSLRRRIEGEFLYRGVTTLDIRELAVSDDNVVVAFNARPVFPDDRRIRNTTRSAAFAQQLFQDAVTILRVVWGAVPRVESISLTAWLKLVDGGGQEVVLLHCDVTRERAAGIFAKGVPLNRLAPIDVLRRFPTRTRVDAHGNFHEERLLT